MLNFVHGDLFDSKAEALVNTVNTVGVMGKGLALDFKQRYPGNFELYKAACEIGLVAIGSVFITRPDDLVGPKWIVNFPTKEHWRHRSQLAWIQSGLKDLKTFITQYGVRSIAIPPLGAGLGGLYWPDVRALIIEVLGNLKDVEILVYGSPPGV